MHKIHPIILLLALILSATVPVLPANASLEDRTSTATRSELAVPPRSWEHDVIDKLWDLNGFITCSVFKRPDTLQMTRHDFAVATLRLKESNWWDYGNHPVEKMVGKAEIEDALAALEREFKPEINKLSTRE